jgi:GT2 family glycosyltransferase
MRRLLAPAGDAPIEPGPIPSFSIVIPAYQAAGFIADSVESALEQTLEPREVIVCDDGSTDYLGSALAPFRERITLLRQAHRGAGAARNAAVRVASGEFVVMLDADDVYEPERLSALAELAAARPDLDILGTDLSYEVAGAPDGRFYQFTEFPLQHQRLAILESCFVACPALRRARVLEVGGFDESLAIAQDWDLFVRLILGGCKAGIVDEPLLRYRKHPHSARGNLDRCLVRARARSALTDAKVVTSSRPPGLRRSLLALAATKNIPPTTRLTLGAAALAPVAARSVLDWKERRVAGIRPRRPRPIS